jgi:hypothetical protein
MSHVVGRHTNAVEPEHRLTLLGRQVRAGTDLRAREFGAVDEQVPGHDAEPTTAVRRAGEHQAMFRRRPPSAVGLLRLAAAPALHPEKRCAAPVGGTYCLTGTRISLRWIPVARPQSGASGRVAAPLRRRLWPASAARPSGLMGDADPVSFSLSAPQPPAVGRPATRPQAEVAARHPTPPRSSHGPARARAGEP